MANTDHAERKFLHHEWMNVQKQELSELEQAARLHEKGEIDESQLKQLVEKVMVSYRTMSRGGET